MANTRKKLAWTDEDLHRLLRDCEQDELERQRQDYIGQWPEDWQQRANGSVEPEATLLEKLFFAVSAVATVVLIIWLGGGS